MKNSEIERELQLAQLMVKDLEKLWKSYAKKALVAKQERELKREKKGFLEYESLNELIDGWGYGDIDEETYQRGIAYFEAQDKPPTLSLIEAHRLNIKELLNRWKGTANELNEELDPTVKDTENIFEKMDRAEREERSQNLLW